MTSSDIRTLRLEAAHPRLPVAPTLLRTLASSWSATFSSSAMSSCMRVWRSEITELRDDRLRRLLARVDDRLLLESADGFEALSGIPTQGLRAPRDLDPDRARHHADQQQGHGEADGGYERSGAPGLARRSARRPATRR